MSSCRTHGFAAALEGFTVAVSHRYKNNGEWQDVTDGFFRCTAWRSVAETAAKSLRKGQRVLVADKLVQRTFETEGHKRSVVEIQVQQVGPDLQFATQRSRRPPLRSRARSSSVREKSPAEAGLFSRLKILSSRSQLRAHSEELTEDGTQRGHRSDWAGKNDYVHFNKVEDQLISGATAG